MREPALLVLDLGNSALKTVVFDARGRVISFARIPGQRAAAAALLLKGGEYGALPLAAVSVRADRLPGVEAALRPRRLLLVGRDLPLGRGNRTRRPGETGHDRLCAAAAAFARARGPAVAAGIGTAITVDAVDGEGAFLGGSIAPGLSAASAGLSAAAPRLPGADRAPGTTAFPGRTTRAALRAGLLLGFAGLVDRLAEEAVRAAAGEARRPVPRVPVLLHGGDAPSLLPLLRRPVIHAPHLVAEGVRVLWLAARG